mmetsp:Transcript_15401/g.36751  ORF Transcript_15401/g.36751 Transcript_15401/m.36751 type:complete len:164 (-) Transcript_15401:164-655(-)|eukprot:CAMPEP_0185822626 /NCGR_PEP_ID=MMETSP1322-20130828/27028_1 /TAXON_ID=265543 /ORGANISM="Minutocellus polymorphus, Strain RCC2270" /LENGTH=163 /DNA_ID=CAMNT_0028520115 /DNA_START=202 /DNA_END=693 /DNA_ORIENTATION=-
MAKIPDNTESLSLQLSASLSLEERSDSEGAKKNSDADANLDTSDRKLLSTPRPRRARMRTKQMSDISSLLSSEPSTPVPASPLTPLFLAGRSPQGRNRLRKQPSDLSGMFALGPPALPLVGNMNTEATKEEETTSDEKPMLVAKGQNRKGRTFGLRSARKNTI